MVEQQLIDTRRSRSGFSVLEAMIALVITGLALTLIFSIGNRASTGGFSLGRRVLSITDHQIEALSFRALIEGLVVPSALDSAPANMGLRVVGPANLVGTPTKLSGSAVLGRDTICADAGPVTQIELEVQSQGGRSQLVCKIKAQPPVVLMDFGRKSVRFAYSQDGNIWRDYINVRPGAFTPKEFDTRFRARSYYVRLWSDDLSVLYLEKATSGRPRPTASALENM